MPPSTWLLNTAGGMAWRYIQRRGRRAAGNYVTRKFYKTLAAGRSSRNLRGTRRRGRLVAKPATKRSMGSAKRATGMQTGPSYQSRTKRARYTAQLGVPVTKHTSKKHTLHTSGGDISDKQLAVQRLIAVPYSDDDTKLDHRQGKLCNVKGVKMRFWFSYECPFFNAYTSADPNSSLINIRQMTIDPIQIRWAILNPKDNDGLTTNKDLKFFDSENPGVDDAKNFPTTGNCFQFMNRKINNRQYGVVKEGTFILQPGQDSDGWTNGPRNKLSSKKLINLWLPIKKQVRWENNATGTGDEFPTTNLFFVWWYCRLGDSTDPRKYPVDTINPIKYHYEKCTYWEDVSI